MLKTCTGPNSLLLWNQTANRSNILQENGNTELDNIINALITDFFTDLSRVSSTGSIVRFTPIWAKASNQLVKKTIKEISEYCKTKNTDPSSEMLKRVAMKLRGNVGEIFTEQFLKSFGDEYDCDSDRYEPVNPHAEYKLDASSYSIISEEVPIGIQVKNWDSPLTEDVFISAGYEAWVAIKSLDSELVSEYLKAPRQYIFSFTDPENNLWLENPRNAGLVKFIGPAEIDKHTKSIQVVLKKICNSL